MPLRSNCTVCLEDWDDDLHPHTLQCGHVFCDDCIERLRRHSRNNMVNCPTCRAEWDMSKPRNKAVRLFDVDWTEERRLKEELALNKAAQEAMQNEIRALLEAQEQQNRQIEELIETLHRTDKKLDDTQRESGLRFGQLQAARQTIEKQTASAALAVREGSSTALGLRVKGIPDMEIVTRLKAYGVPLADSIVDRLPRWTLRFNALRKLLYFVPSHTERYAEYLVFGFACAAICLIPLIIFGGFLYGCWFFLVAYLRPYVSTASIWNQIARHSGTL